MAFSVETKDTIKGLGEWMESPHFIIRYGLRNPPSGRGLGADGVRDRALVLTYLNALESLYRVMTSPPWNRERPVVGAGKLTEIYICDSEPFTSYDDHKVPLIVLSSRSCEPTTHAELCRAAAEAVHEGTHLFNFTYRPLYETSSDPWVWFDEGMAVLMETLVVAGNPDYFRYLTDWIDAPEMSLDEPEENYQSGMFLRYLYQSLGPDLINDVWTKSDAGEGPLDALKRFAGKRGRALSSPLPWVDDIFGSGYCIDPYFMWDHASVTTVPDLLVRFGERAVSQSCVLKPGAGCKIEDSLNHLSCRYYRLYPRRDVSRLLVRVAVEDHCYETPLKAELAVVDVQRRRARVVPLLQSPAAGGRGCHLITVVPDLQPEAIDHLVLVVSNCGTRSLNRAKGSPHDDLKSYRIEATAL